MYLKIIIIKPNTNIITKKVKKKKTRMQSFTVIFLTYDNESGLIKLFHNNLLLKFRPYSHTT